MNEYPQNRYELLERKRNVDAAWFLTLPFLLVFSGLIWHSRLAPIQFMPLLKVNLVFMSCYIAAHLFIENVEMGIRFVRLSIFFSFILIMLQITATIHYLGGYEGVPFFMLYLIPIIASGTLFTGWYPLGCAAISAALLTILFLLESPSFVWYLAELGAPSSIIAVFNIYPLPHYSIFGFDPAPATHFTILLSSIFMFFAFAMLSQTTAPLLDRLYRLKASMEKDIEGRENLFNLSLYNAPVGFVIGYCANYQPVYINKAVLNMFRLDETVVAGNDMFSMISFEPEIRDLLISKIDSGEPVNINITSITMADGSKVFFEIRLNFLDYPAPEGEERMFLLIINNLTTEVKLSNIVENSSDAIVFLDLSSRVNYFNRAAQSIFPGIAKGALFEFILDATGAFGGRDICRDIVIGKPMDGKVQFEEKTYIFSSFFMRDATGLGLGVLFSLKDITNEETFFNLSVKDELTGLYNRRYFFDLLEKELAQSERYPKPLSLAIFDIDFFKKINDTYGHQAGDMILKAFANTVSSSIRKADIVARIGGEEFAIYMPFVDVKGAGVICEKLRVNVENLSPSFNGQRIPVTCSIGIAEYSQKDKVDSLFARADGALYKAKNGGRNQVVTSE
ncbi:MAG: diguanylate cyclase [Nitrospinae bacterium]|nr:diguanylate cyclase [Nitrospinota bacterium]